MRGRLGRRASVQARLVVAEHHAIDHCTRESQVTCLLVKGQGLRVTVLRDRCRDDERGLQDTGASKALL